LTLLLVYGGAVLGGEQGMVIAFVFAVVLNFGSYFYSDKIVLKMYKAREVSQRDEPRLVQTVRELARRANMPMPKVYLIPSKQPNAFATGRNPEHSAVAVTEGIKGLLNEEELAGVLAHELAHVKNRDILIGTVAATVAAAISMLATMAQWALIFGGGRGNNRGGHPVVMIVMMIVAPLAAMLIQMAISRTREYKADATAAALIGSGIPLANALKKLESGAARIPMDAEPATAHMFIVSPLTGKKSGGLNIRSLFSTHPPMQKRIARLVGERAG
jgi:heat shock protein HtpX